MNKYKDIDSTAFTAFKYIFNSQDFSADVLEKTHSKRTLFYSTVLAVSSALLIFIGQNHTVNEGLSKIPVVISISSFALCVIILLVVHFINIILDLTYGKGSNMLVDAASEGLTDAKKWKESEYFKHNPDKYQNFSNIIYLNKTLRSVMIYLDFVILVCIFIGIVSYSINLFQSLV